VFVRYTRIFGDVKGFNTTAPAPVAKIYFDVLAEGSTMLDLHDTLLNNIFGQAITHGAVDGYFSNIPGLQPPIAWFEWAPEKPAASETVNFTFTGTDPDGTIVSWQWDLNGDGFIDRTTENTTWVFPAPGEYNVTLTVTDDDAQTDVYWKLVTVYEHDVAVVSVITNATQVISRKDLLSINVTVVNEGDFDETPDVTVYYSNATFSANVYPVLSRWLPAGGNDTLHWTWNTTYPTYVNPGTYNISATVSVVQYEIDTGDNTLFNGTVTVFVHDIVIVDVTPFQTEVTKPNPVSINVTVANRGNFSETFNVTTYYDDQSIDKQTNITLDAGANETLTFAWNTTYVSAVLTGTPYNISATASNVQYEANTTNNEFIDGTVTVYALVSANFTYSPKTPVVGETVTFDASPSEVEPGKTIDSYAWDFGDNTTEIYVGANLTTTATHAYAAAGNYIVTLNITDSGGLSDAIIKTVTVYIRDVAIFSVTPSPIEVVVGESVSISVAIVNQGGLPETINVTTYYNETATHWVAIGTKAITIEVGRTTTSRFTWDTSGVALGNYIIKANTTVLPGETDIDDNEKISRIVTVEQKPIASFTFYPAAPIVNQNITFNATDSTPDGGELIDPDGYAWDFGDGTNATGVIVDHAYAAAGTYNVSLTVTDTEGLSDSIWQLIEVILHDVAVIGVTPSATDVVIGKTITINVVVENQGTVSEDFTVTIYYPNNIIGTQTVTLGAGANTTISFSWDTTGVASGTYTLSANASVVSGETDTTDNIFQDGEVTVRKPTGLGDVVYVVAGVAVIIALAIGIYILRIRKSKPT